MENTLKMLSDTKQLVYNPAIVDNAISLWANHTTDNETQRYNDLIRDKSNAVSDFFNYANKHPILIQASDILDWQKSLKASGLSNATIYAYVSRVSSFYSYLMNCDRFQNIITGNPAQLARPKAPKAYQNESTQALDIEDVKKLIATVKEKADTGKISAMRDYALLLFYLFSGLRRNEVIQLAWKNIKLNGVVTITIRLKGGDIITKEIKHPALKDAIIDYLTFSNRLQDMQADTPLWTAHDRSGLNKGTQLSSHAFVKNLKKYAHSVGIEHIHLHQLRHTFAVILKEQGASIADIQDALNHKNQQTTLIYTGKLTTKKDRASSIIADTLDI